MSKHSNQDLIEHDLPSRVDDHTDGRRRRRMFNVGRVLGINIPHARL